MSLLEPVTSHLIDKTVITIETSDFNGEKIMERCSSIFNKKLKFIINENIEQLALNNSARLSLPRVVVDLGNIAFDSLEAEMPNKLATGLKKALSQYYRSSEYPLRAEKIAYPQSSMVTTDSAFAETQLIAKVDHYLRKGVWPSGDNEHYAADNLRMSDELLQHIHREPQQWLPMLVKHCLQPAGLSRLMQICQPAVLHMLCQLLTETATSEFVNSQAIIDTKMTPARLSAAAEHYLRHQMRDANATQQATTLQAQKHLTSARDIAENSRNPLKADNSEANILTGITLQAQKHLTSVRDIAEHSRNPLKPDNGKTDTRRDAAPPFSQQPIPAHHQKDPIQPRSEEQKQSTLQNGEQHKGSLKSVSPAPISSLQPDSAIPTPLAQSVLSVSNAGCMILWPLLPTFFSTFGLLDKNQFISLEAQREAVCLLDWLIWAEDEIPAWRLTLNKVICGLPMNDNALWRAPAPEQQSLISHWLENTIVQLPAWKKMGVSDVRHLFLQRSGELSELNGVTNIHIKPEVYDALIGEWPWPINMASFSWLKQPLTMTWL
ncbi:contractile injection system tape measure protein [Xenorhabdus bovienii]|uniref:contractile injection system tape measure protein n=1 Tax=Xenorhabdus bovienii TaxID=40576 RepID=UPI0023B3022B|nr:contractile injection system tape measure protein [Xenorhabdus bovienii]MDE9430789.1 hypothetical protein [Xenorhabdus bovienii]MDE9488432.1 hypothetical protein [Xenorhabdus bovienii]MDE9504811.1 hypothetical protein [Xenorhabdus bovienii]MDE9546281.1 hypothetical protein [Xenorhabdus bovienii]